jgi:hypothetical protein
VTIFLSPPNDEHHGRRSGTVDALVRLMGLLASGEKWQLKNTLVPMSSQGGNCLTSQKNSLSDEQDFILVPLFLAKHTNTPFLRPVEPNKLNQ